ncbi:MAG: class I SAM-dependent methyltransferase [Halobacteriales archaeon]
MVTDRPREPPAVRATFERIAAHFDATRRRPWPAVEAFLGSAPRGACGLDLGCGNGRHLRPLSATVERAVGVDVSRAMLGHARTNAPGVDLLEGSALAVPLRSGAVDVALYVATLHHLPDRRRRVASLDELARVLAADGVGLISVWSVHHERFDDLETATATTVDWTLPDGTVVPRFYHLYDRETLDAELAASDLAVERRWAEAGNLYARVRGADP